MNWKLGEIWNSDIDIDSINIDIDIGVIWDKCYICG